MSSWRSLTNMAINQDQEVSAAINWKYLEVLLANYQSMVINYKHYLLCRGGAIGDGDMLSGVAPNKLVAFNRLNASMCAYLLSVQFKFKEYLEVTKVNRNNDKDKTLLFQTEFAGSKLTYKRISNLGMITRPNSNDEKDLLEAVTVLCYWSTTYGNFATFNDVDDLSEGFW